MGQLFFDDEDHLLFKDGQLVMGPYCCCGKTCCRCCPPDRVLLAGILTLGGTSLGTDHENNSAICCDNPGEEPSDCGGLDGDPPDDARICDLLGGDYEVP